jgi:tetratricopeptide (TPR) repeat protein
MTIKSMHRFGLLLLLLWALGRPIFAQKKPPSPDAKPAALRQEAEANLTEGMKFFMMEEYEKALDPLQKALEIVPNDAGLLFQMAKTYDRLGQTEKAMPSAEKAYKIEPQNKYYALLLADLHMKSRQMQPAIKIYQQLIAQSPENAEYGIELAAIYIMNQQLDEAIKAYNVVEKQLGINEDLTYQKQAVLIQFGKFDQAIKEGDRLIESDPTETSYLRHQAELLITNGQETKAIEYLKKVLQISPENGEAHLMMAEVYRQQGDNERCAQALNAAFDDPALDPSVAARALVNYITLLNTDESSAKALAMVKRLVQQNPTEGKYYGIMGDLYVRQKSLREARKAYQKAAVYNSGINEIWSAIIKIDSDLQEIDSMIVHTEQAIELFPNHALFWYQNGAGHLIKRRYPKAISALEEARKLAPEGFELLPFILSGLGDAYNGSARHSESDEAYEEALKADPENDHVLNNYSYYLSLRKEKLPRALLMAAQLVERHPDNGTYLDTYGWVLYVNKDYEKAKIYLERAVQQKPRSGTILEHLGDVYFQLGEKEKAIEIWKKAMTLGSVTPLLDKKITEGRLIE